MHLRRRDTAKAGCGGRGAIGIRRGRRRRLSFDKRPGAAYASSGRGAHAMAYAAAAAPVTGAPRPPNSPKTINL